jgi:hypothetical protein
MYNRAFRPWALAALSGLLLMTACEDTSTVPTDLDPQLAKGGNSGRGGRGGEKTH